MKFIDDILKIISDMIDAVFDSHLLLIGVIVAGLMLVGAIYIFLIR